MTQTFVPSNAIPPGVLPLPASNVPTTPPSSDSFTTPRGGPGYVTHIDMPSNAIAAGLPYPLANVPTVPPSGAISGTNPLLHANHIFVPSNAIPFDCSHPGMFIRVCPPVGNSSAGPWPPQLKTHIFVPSNAIPIVRGLLNVATVPHVAALPASHSG